MKKGKAALTNMLCGVVIGASMLVPGVSGGTMAILLGIYDRLVSAVGGLVRSPRKSLFLLGMVALGGILGAACFSGLLLSLLQAYPKPVLFFFSGAVLGSFPLLFQKARVFSFRPDALLYILTGLFLSMLLGTLPTGFLSPSNTGWSSYLTVFAAGLLLSVALVLPGISASYLLLVLGLYQPVLTAVSQREFPFLLTLGLGTGVGVFAVTGALERAMTRHTRPTYLIIIGFVAASLAEIFPGLPTGWDIPRSLLAVLLGFGGVFFLSRRFGEER